MKIALLHYSYAPVVGGVELVVAEHAALFARHGHQVEIVTPPELNCDHLLTRAAQRELETGKPRKNFDELTRGFEAVFTPIFRAMHVVMIHNVLTMPFNLACTAALWKIAPKLPRTRFVGWVHDLALCNPDFTFPHRDREPWSFMGAASPHFKYVAVSEHRRSEFEKLTGVACEVIPNGIDPIAFMNLTEPVRKLVEERNVLENDLVLLHPARIVKRKNIELGLHLAAAMKPLGIRPCLLVTGPPDMHNSASAGYREFVSGLASKLGVTREVIFVHDLFAVNKNDLVSLYNVSDALFYPSRQEGFGIPILEAALHRIPIFCSDIEPMKALARPDVTFFDPDIEPAKLARTIAAFAAASHSIQGRKETLGKYAWESIYSAYLEPMLNNCSVPTEMPLTTGLHAPTSN